MQESPEHAIWLSPVTQLLLQSTTNTRCADRSRLTHAVVLLSASLIRTFPAESSSLLFSSQLAVPFGNTSKPVSWLFVQHRLVDIRSSIPSLPEKLNGPEYKVVSERLAECYVIISAFTGFFMGGATNDKENDYSEVLPFTRDLTDILLKTLSDACSVTVDYLCERYAAGPNQMRRDPFTKAQLRMLAMWLPKDDGTKLRDGPVSILDVTFGLYGEQEDTRMPILMITEQATSHPSGVDKFHRNGGWVVLFHELESIIELPSPSQQTHSNGVLILDILRKVATHDIEAGNAHEHWMDVVRLACKLDTEGSAEGLDLKYQMAALAAEFYELFLQSGKERRPGTLKQLLKVVSRLLTKRGRVGETTVGELEEAMENLRLLKGNSG